MKIKLHSGRSLFRKRLFFSIMKTFILLFCTTVFSLTSDYAFSQEKVLIYKDQLTSVENVFRIIQKQTKYAFIYPKALFKDAPKVNLKKGEITIDELLKLSILHNELNFELTQDNVIVIKEKEVVTLDIVQQQVTGTIVDAQGVPLPGANILEKGTANGTQSDFDGNFALKVSSKDAVLVISYVGFLSQEIAVLDRTVFNIVLKDDAARLDEVVITALGIKKETKSLGYAVQEVKGESMVKAREPNIVNSLTGKVAGLTIKNSTDLYQNPDITLRGGNPLIVIDGIPSTDNDYWKLNADDINEISVLKGATASALYGSIGRSGALMITTKRGTLGETRVEYNTSAMFQTSYLRIPNVQSTYGNGNNGIYEYIDGSGSGAEGGGYIWGPRLDQLDSSTPSGFREIVQYNSPIDPNTGERVPIPFISRGKDNVKTFLTLG